jgi:hypothetical protein
MATSATKCPLFAPPFFYCESCDHKCIKKRDYERHVATRKHEKSTKCNVLATENAPIAPQVFSCIKCSKTYKDRTGLWRHNKKCQTTNNEPKNDVICKLIQQNMELVTQNQELQKQLIELAKESKVTTINNNCNNKNKFNMNIFLNEKCKDALNIMDFIDSLQLQLKDLEETGRLGYIQGISRIFINGLKELDVSKRPIHCSDIKRETLYVKDNNEWNKEDSDKKKITRAIKHISIRNAKQINEWTKENHGYNNSMHKNSDKYLKLISEANGGEPEEINKIISIVSSNVIVDKNN